MHQAPVIEAASVLLAQAFDAQEAFVIQRSQHLDFFGGYCAFPGGKVDPEDAEIPLREDKKTIFDARRVTAIRELFEETGVLLAHHDDGSFPIRALQWNHERELIIQGEMTFHEFLKAQNLHLDATDLIFAGNLITPEFAPRRFDTSFFVAVLPPGQETDVWPGELEDGFWATAEQTLERWRQRKYPVSPPTVTMLELVRGRPILDLPQLLLIILDRLKAGALPLIPFAPGVELLPLQTTGLPPSTVTNAYLVGTDKTYLIDPGAHEPGEQQRLFDALDALPEHRKLCGILLTHHHPDHVGAVKVCAERYGIPIYAHVKTAQHLKEELFIDHYLDEGDRVDLGRRPDGAESWFLEVLHLPGHASGHLVFFEPYYQLVFAGDLVSMLSSVIIAPPDGDLMQYLASLKRLQELECGLLLPGHGSPSSRPSSVLERCLEHRARREEQLLEALRSGPRSMDELVAEIYPEISPEILRLARLQLLAGLQKLETEGRVRGSGEERYELTSEGS